MKKMFRKATSMMVLVMTVLMIFGTGIGFSAFLLSATLATDEPLDATTNTTFTTDAVYLMPSDVKRAVNPYEASDMALSVWIAAECDNPTSYDRNFKVEYALYQSDAGWTSFDTLISDYDAADDSLVVSADDDVAHPFTLALGAVPAEQIKFKFTALTSCDVDISAGLIY